MLSVVFACSADFILRGLVDLKHGVLSLLMIALASARIFSKTWHLVRKGTFGSVPGINLSYGH
jgi:hypothetical protein